MFDGRGRALALLVLLAMAWASWLFRYDMKTVASTDGYSLAYRLDRWTGNMRMIEDDHWAPVVEATDEDAIVPPKSSSMNLKRGQSF